MRPNALSLVAALGLLGCGLLGCGLLGCGSEVIDDGNAGGGGASSSGAETGTGGSTSTSTSSSMATTTAGTTSSSTSTGNGGGPSFAACSEPGTCTLAQKDCCGPCGRPGLDDFDPIAVSAEDAHFAVVCPDPDGTPCPGCAAELNPGLFAYCDLAAGRCAGADLPATELAACEAASDCVLRAGAGCCTFCGDLPPEAWVALRADAGDDLAALVCQADTGCPACEPVPPEGLMADCLGGVCTVTILESTSSGGAR